MLKALVLMALALALTGCGDDEPAAGGSPTGPPEGLASEGCPAPRASVSKDSAHIAEGEKVTYPTDPPASGRHLGRVANTGVHAQPIQDEVQVHNLEHGHVVIQYRAVTPSQFAVLRAQVQRDPRNVILAPRPAMEAALALTSWGVIQTCDAFPSNLAEVVSAFVVANKDKAPESIPGAPGF